MGRRALACLAVLAVAGCGGGAAKPPEHAKAADRAAHASGPRLTPAVARKLESDFRAQVKDTGAPGATAAVIFPNGREWTSAVGLAVLHPATPMTARTSFLLASVTKVATAALALKLAEEGRLSLDDPVRRWYPAWRGDPAATVRDLLGHTSGAKDPADRFYDPLIRHPRRATTARDFVAASPKPGPRTQLGSYSNTGFLIAGLVLARAGGAPLAALMRRELFAGRPGGDGLALQPAERPRPPLAHGYVYPHGDLRPVDITGDSAFLPDRALAGVIGSAGALAGSDLSLARWAHQLLGGHLLRPGSLREMTRFHSIDYLEGYGLGLVKASQDGHAMWGHTGHYAGTHTELWHLPREDVTVAVSLNDELADSTSPILRTLVRHALGTA